MNREVRCTLILSVVAYFVLLGVSLISPILPLYALSFDASLFMVGALISGFGVARLIMDVPTGMMVDRFGIKRFMIYGVAIVFFASLVCGFALDYWMLLVGRIFEGVGSAMYSTASFTCIGRIAPERKRGKYMSFYLGMFLLGSVSGPAIGGYVGESMGLSAPFFFYAGTAAFSFFLIQLGINESTFGGKTTGQHNKVNIGQIGNLLRNFTFVAISVAIFAIFVGRMGITATLVPIFAYSNLGTTAATLGIVLTLSALANLVIMVPAGSLTDRYGRKPFMVASVFLAGLSVMLIPFTQDMVGFVIVMIVLGFSFGLSGPIIAWVTDITSSDQLGTAMGIFRTMSDAGFVVGPIVLTLLPGSSAGSVGLLPFLVAGGLLIVASALLLKGTDPRRSERLKWKGKGA
ncbi:MAG: MFS transporter [Methanomassiliicoccales archaeon]|nr:MFS transporter [Methanomassiliicoccales archaeon]